MTIQDLLLWQNALFSVTLVVFGFGPALLMVLGAAGGELDADADVDADVDVDADMEFDVDADADGDFGDVAGGGLLAGFMSFAGVGKVPVTLLISAYAFIFGLVGLSANYIAQTQLGRPFGADIHWSLLIASVSAIVFGSLLARIFSRFVPKNESYGVPAAKLIGRTAEVLVTTTPSQGTIQLRQPGNGLLTTGEARTTKGEIPRGSSVKIVRFNKGANTFIVKKA